MLSRAYRQAVELRLMKPLGGRRLCDLTRVELQDLIDRWRADGLDASTVRNTLLPLRATYRRAIARGTVEVEGPLVEDRAREVHLNFW